MPKKKDDIDNMIEHNKNVHKIWYKFSNWLEKTYGKDLFTESEIEIEVKGKIKKHKSKTFNDFELSKRLVGYEVQVKIEKYVTKHCPEIKIIRCDDAVHASSDLILIPHPTMGITMIFIPQCTSIQNQFFLYKNHHKELVKALNEMKYVYKDAF